MTHKDLSFVSTYQAYFSYEVLFQLFDLKIHNSWGQQKKEENFFFFSKDTLIRVFLDIHK